MRSYAQITSLILQILQDTTPSTYDSTETGYWIEEGLKELAQYDPHIVPIIFKIESRTGTDDTGLASSVSDTAKSQFVGGDATYEKVVHNTTDNTWAIVLANTDTTANTLSADIMDSGESYRIYNKRCWNEKQIYIGDVTDYLEIDSVEYPLGEKRNWKVYGEVLEIDVDRVEDSDSTKDPPSDIDVLVRFAKPHRLCQLTDLVGETHTEAAAGATTMQVKYFTDDQIIEIGDEFHIENHRTTYTVTTGVTLDLQTSTGKPISFFPGLEAVAPAAEHGSGIHFTKSTLKPQHEELFCHLVAARAVLSDNINYINANPTGGVEVWSRYQTWGERKLGEVLSKLSRLSPPKTKRRYPTD